MLRAKVKEKLLIVKGRQMKPLKERFFDRKTDNTQD